MVPTTLVNTHSVGYNTLKEAMMRWKIKVCQRERMGNIVPDALSLRHLSIPAQGCRRFDNKGADRSGVDELN